jgi:hypothetical protein
VASVGILLGARAFTRRYIHRITLLPDSASSVERNGKASMPSVTRPSAKPGSVGATTKSKKKLKAARLNAIKREKGVRGSHPEVVFNRTADAAAVWQIDTCAWYGKTISKTVHTSRIRSSFAPSDEYRLFRVEDAPMYFMGRELYYAVNKKRGVFHDLDACAAGLDAAA